MLVWLGSQSRSHCDPGLLSHLSPDFVGRGEDGGQLLFPPGSHENASHWTGQGESLGEAVDLRERILGLVRPKFIPFLEQSRQGEAQSIRSGASGLLASFPALGGE